MNKASFELSKISALIDRLDLPDTALAKPEVLALAECLYTQRSVRQFSSDPVEPELVEFIITMASRAGSGANRQPWRFIAVTDPSTRSALGDWYRGGWSHYASTGSASRAQSLSKVQQRSVDAARYLADHFEQTPVVIVACYLPGKTPTDFYAGASIYPAIQNLLLAVRAVGLGATLTTMQALSGLDPVGLGATENLSLLDDLRTICAIPAGVVPAAVIPVGWPMENYRVGRRKSVEQILYWDTWSDV